MLINLHDHIASELAEGLEAIHEVSSLESIDSPELRRALAVLVGAIRRSASSHPFGGIDLASLFARKYEAWEGHALESNSHRKADNLLQFHLTNAGLSTISFCPGGHAGSAAQSFRYALDHEDAWSQYELQLCTLSEAEVEGLTLADIAHSLTLLR